MKVVEINATEREDLGGKFARKLRKEGQVPCVVYGGESPIHFYAPTLAFRDLVYTGEAKKAGIKLGDKVVEAVMQDVQFHPVSDQIQHIDFIQLVEGKSVTMEIPVVLKGTARGVINGGRLKQALRKLSVRALPGELPEAIEIDITKLRIGKSIRVNKVKIDGNFEILNAGDAVVVSVKRARLAVEEDEDEDEDEEGAEGAEATAEGGEGAAPEASAE